MDAALQISSELADANLLESIRAIARWQEPCECDESDGVLLVAGANAAPRAYRNCVARVDPRVSALDVLARARAFFDRRQRGFTVFVRVSRDADLEKLLQSQGFVQRSDAPCMIIDRPLAAGITPAGVRVEPISHTRHVLDCIEVTAEAYQALDVPPEEMRLYFNRPARLLSDEVVGFVAYRDGRPLSTALTIMSGRSAGLYFVGTIKDAERQGLGELCTRLATNAGFARGASIVTLQASPFGEPIYRRLGYTGYDRLRWYR